MNTEQQSLYSLVIGVDELLPMITLRKAMKKSKREIKNRILSFTKKRVLEKSISPSEVTKDLFSDVWKDHVDEVRTVAGEMQSERLISITQGGNEVPKKKAKGPIRLKLYRQSD